MHTGSFINHLQGASKQPEPEVGMGATILMWSDREAATIVSVSKSGKRIEVQRDHAKRTDNNGLSESQTYEFTPNPEGPRIAYTLRKNGQWVREGESMKGGQRLRVGSRDHYYDFSF